MRSCLHYALCISRERSRKTCNSSSQGILVSGFNSVLVQFASSDVLSWGTCVLQACIDTRDCKSAIAYWDAPTIKAPKQQWILWGNPGI